MPMAWMGVWKASNTRKATLAERQNEGTEAPTSTALRPRKHHLIAMLAETTHFMAQVPQRPMFRSVLSAKADRVNECFERPCWEFGNAAFGGLWTQRQAASGSRQRREVRRSSPCVGGEKRRSGLCVLPRRARAWLSPSHRIRGSRRILSTRAQCLFGGLARLFLLEPEALPRVAAPFSKPAYQ